MKMKTQNHSHRLMTNPMTGDSISHVIYYSPYNNSNALIGTRKTPSHTLDKALLLKMQSGGWYGFFHGTEFGQQGIDIVLNPYEVTKSSTSDIDFWDASRHQNWSNIIHQTVVSVEPIWNHGSPSSMTLYPQAVRITFENQTSIYICVPKSSDEIASYWNPCEEVMVIFDERMAKGYLALVK